MGTRLLADGKNDGDSVCWECASFMVIIWMLAVEVLRAKCCGMQQVSLVSQA